MNFGAAVLTFREGLEAALIVAILLGYLRKMERLDVRGFVWSGAAIGIALTTVFVVVLQLIGAEFEDPVEAIYAGTTSLLAVGVVTYMTFWMSRNGRRMKGELEAGVRSSLARGSAWGLLTLAFLAVIREGVETALFLSAAAFTTSELATLTGGLLGLAAAVAAAIAIYRGGIHLDLGMFFRVAGVLLVVFGAAILRYGVSEFEDVGLLPPLVEPLWNTGGLLSDSNGVGAVLQPLVGYTATPSLMQLLAFGGYYLVVGLALWRPWRQLRARVTPASPGAVS